ncbi:MAG: hypothetical protein JST06_00895 [Bacteroidetes bacterium]|nr:hypothetical protein [Bacteroidota bacterium]
MKGAHRKHSWNLLFALLIVLEECFVLYLHKGSLPNAVNELGLFASSMLIGVLVLIRYYGRSLILIRDTQRVRFKTALFPEAVLIIGFLFFVWACADLFREQPVDLKWSDIIPTIQVAVERFLHGERVYTTIFLHSHTLPLTYLPMQWLPYTLAGYLHVDFRWIAVSICFIGCGGIVWRSAAHSARYASYVAGLLLLCGWMMMKNDSGPVTSTVELMVVGYYMLLVAGLSGKNAWLCGAGIALCLLSRYSLVLWLPLWAFALFISGERTFLFRATLLSILAVLLIYILPFLSKDWSTWWQSYQYYTRAALGEWSHPGQNGIPFQLDHGIGFARLFYQNLPSLSLAERIQVLQRAQVIVLLSSNILMGIWYWKKRSKMLLRPFLLGSFKIYLSLFFAFIQVPYIYLMLPSIGVSIALFAEMGRWETEVNEPEPKRLLPFSEPDSIGK